MFVITAAWLVAAAAVAEPILVPGAIVEIDGRVAPGR
jgi:hypothetical protein